jgi:hypothetical protein
MVPVSRLKKKIPVKNKNVLQLGGDALLCPVEEIVMNFRSSLLLLAFLAVVCLSWAADVQSEPLSIHGWVLDSACAITKGLNKPISRDCALKCAKAGSPLVILADDGNIYWPISDNTPSSGQNERLLPFAGERVTASGKGYVRGGSHAIVLEKIQADKSK